MKIRAWVWVGCALIPAMAAAQQAGLSAPVKKSAAQILVLKNGRIFTNDPGNPWAEAVVIRDGKFVYAGRERGAEKWTQAGAQVVDLKGRFAMPGFNDAHVHIGSAGAGKLSVPLAGSRSIEEMQARIRAPIKAAGPGDWIVGQGWDHTLWAEKRFPTRQALDAVSKDHPMIFQHVSGHVAVANSRALALAGITKATPNPAGGEIERDAAGEPTGMLKEGPAMRLVYAQVPPPSLARARRGIEMALAEAARYGVTSIQDNSISQAAADAPGNSTLRVLEQLRREDKLPVRITEWLPFDAPMEDLERLRAELGTSDPWLKSGALKLVTDGALGTRTAALAAPYADDGATSGILIVESERMKEMAIERDRAGFQLAFHVIGDRANKVALDVFAAVRAANGPRDRRDRIEHAQVVLAEDFARFAQLGVIASMQPSHETTDMRWAEQRLGPERSKGAYAWASMLRRGVHLAFGTDHPVEAISPMRGLYACVTRELPQGGPAGGWQPQEKISLEDCIAAYTTGSAYAEFEDGKKGRIRPGEYADLIVLSADITKIPPPELLRTEVLQTIAGGRTTYAKESH